MLKWEYYVENSLNKNLKSLLQGSVLHRLLDRLRERLDHVSVGLLHLHLLRLLRNHARLLHLHLRDRRLLHLHLHRLSIDWLGFSIRLLNMVRLMLHHRLPLANLCHFLLSPLLLLISLYIVWGSVTKDLCVSIGLELILSLIHFYEFASSFIV